MRDNHDEFVEFAWRLSRQHEQVFKQTELPAELRQRFLAAAEESRRAQQRIEAADDVPFETYVARYFDSA
jgi:glutamate--cysteine ligase